MAKRKKLQLDDIPTTLQNSLAIIDREISRLEKQESLSDAEAKLLISYVDTLSKIYNDHRQRQLATLKDLKAKSTEELTNLIKMEGAA